MERNIAVVGVGYWGKNLVRDFYELGALHTICDVNQELGTQFKSQFSEIRSVESFDRLLNDPAIKAVVIATPAVHHYQMAKDALLAKKHVFVEKPLALKVDQGAELVKLAEQQNLILMVGHILQYHPALEKLKELIDRGDLGKIQYIYSNRLNIGKIRFEENILWSFAPHDISAILFLLNEMPETVCATGGSYLQAKIPDVTLTTMDFKSGVKSHIFVSWLHPFKEQKLVVVGDKKMAVFDDMSKGEIISLSS
ncbi:MAG: Gfo/Idh/MocA family oxidoreductase [Candidatus Scalindua sp.]|nr:Gfo/Idh/MocA family oxidoreductase [Candidatus Scalindua sp.]